MLLVRAGSVDNAANLAIALVTSRQICAGIAILMNGCSAAANASRPRAVFVKPHDTGRLIIATDPNERLSDVSADLAFWERRSQLGRSGNRCVGAGRQQGHSKLERAPSRSRRQDEG
jgi:hypothetical protein